MANIPPIFLDSNFCRYPHLVKQWGPYEGLALDLLVFLAAKTHRPRALQVPLSLSEHPTVYFHASDFCATFGHPRQLLHQPLGPAAEAILKDFPPSVRREIITPIDFVLFMMDARNVMFNMKTAGTLYRMADSTRKVIHESDKVGVIHKFSNNRLQEERLARQPISYTMIVLAGFVANNHYLGQAIDLATYLNVCTPGGEESETEEAASVTLATEEEPTEEPTEATAKPARKLTKAGLPRKLSRPRTWPAGRRLYVRLLWRLGMWKSAAQLGTPQQTDDFEELCVIAGLFNPNVKTRASKLRQMLESVCELTGLPFTTKVERIKPSYASRQLLGRNVAPYQVRLTAIAPKEVQPPKRRRAAPAASGQQSLFPSS